MGSPQKAQTTYVKSRLAQAKETVLHNDGFFFTLLRSSVSSQLCGWIDTLLSFIAFSFLGFTPFLSTAFGAFIGGILNCSINYKFTFHAEGIDWRIALTKYLFVWTGSLLLNSFGTQIIYHLFGDWDWLVETTGITKDGIFLAARLFVALMVSLCWNFLLQRNFVFKVTWIDRYIAAFLKSIGLYPKSKQ